MHQNRSKTATWTNDTKVETAEKAKSLSRDDYLNFDSESEQETDDENEDDLEKGKSQTRGMANPT